MQSLMSAVPTHRQHHGRPPHLRLGSRIPNPTIRALGRAAAMGQPHHGHLRRSGARHRPSDPEDPEPQAGEEIRSAHHPQYVEDDHRPGHLPARRDVHPPFRREADLRLRDRDGRVWESWAGDGAAENHGVQHVRVDADFQ